MQWLSVRRYNYISKAQHRLISRTDTLPHFAMLHICASLGRLLIIIFKPFTHALADKLKLPPVELKLDILLD